MIRGIGGNYLLDLFSNFKHVRGGEYLIDSSFWIEIPSGPSLVSRAGDAGSTERKDKVP